MCSIEAEAIARAFIKQRHTGVERIFFSKMYREEDAWILLGKVEFKHAYFFTTIKAFEAHVNINTRKVSFYEEAKLQNSEEQQEKRNL